MEMIAAMKSSLPRMTIGMAIRGASWPTAFLVLVSHATWGDPGYPPEALWCAGILGAMAIVSCAYARVGVMPVLPIVLVRLYLAMGFSVFNPPIMYTTLGPVRISQRAMTDASLGSLLFASALVSVALLVRPLARRLGGALSRMLDNRGEYSAADSVAARLIAGLCVVAAVAHHLRGFDPNDDLGPFTLLGYLLSGPEIPLALLWWDAHKTGSQLAHILCWGAVSVISVAGLSTGMLGIAVFPWLGAAMLSWTLRKRAPIAIVTGGLLAMLIINPAKSAYRQLSWYTGNEVGVMQRAENWALAFAATYGGGEQFEMSDNAATGLASRSSSMLQVIHMFEWVPSRVPFAGPDAWYRLPLYFVPTLLWPDRPRAKDEMTYPYYLAFRMMSQRTIDSHSVTLPSVGDGYWRLGWFGVALEGVLLGVIVGLFHGISRPSSRAVTLFGVGYILAGGGPEGAVLSTVLMLPKVVLVWVSILLLVQWLPYLLSGSRKTRLGATTAETIET